MASLFTPGGAARQDATVDYLRNLPALIPGSTSATSAAANLLPAPLSALVRVLPAIDPNTVATAKNIASNAGDVLFGPSTALTPKAVTSTPIAGPITGNLGNAPTSTGTASDPLSSTTMRGSIPSQLPGDTAPTDIAPKYQTGVTPPATPGMLPSYQAAIDTGISRQQAYGEALRSEAMKYIQGGGDTFERASRARNLGHILPSTAGVNNFASLGEQGASQAAQQQTQRDINASNIGFDRQRLAQTPVPTGQVPNPIEPFGPPLTTYGVRVSPDGTPPTTYAPAQAQLTSGAAKTPVEGSRSTSGGHPIVFRGGKWQTIGDNQ